MPMTKRAIFIGRFSPFHKGHLGMMKKKIDQNVPLLILIRDTHYDLYPARLRKRMIDATMAKLKIDAKCVIIDDIESVNYGRGVGYQVNNIDVDENTKRISATDIRSKIEKGDETWKEMIPKGADNVLENYLKRKGVVVWLTGLSASGKTTTANAVSDELLKRGIRTERLDGDVLREHLTKDLGFSKKDREENLMRAAFVAKLLARNGVIVIASFITPYNKVRDRIRKELEGETHFVEVFVKATVETCAKRDVKGLYAKAMKGEIKNFTGVNDPFDEPKNPELVLDTEKKSVEECAEQVVEIVDSLI